MLELEIKALREEIALLREALTGLTGQIAPKQTPVEATTTTRPPLPVEQKPVQAVAEAPVEQPAATAAPAITRDDLQSLCMSIVRADRTKRDAITQAIAKYGATNLVGVKDQDLQALYADLEALK